MALPPARPTSPFEAYVTLLTTADAAYLAGALTLGSSIRAFDTLRELLVLVTAAVPAAWHEELRDAGFEVVAVEEVQEFWWGREHPRCQSFDPDQDVRWGHEMTKLRLWQLEQYEKLLYIDADAVLLAPADDLFHQGGFAAERGLSGQWFNAGVMLIQPSQQTFDALIARGAGASLPLCTLRVRWGGGYGSRLQPVACRLPPCAYPKPQPQPPAPQAQPRPQPRQGRQLTKPPSPGEPPNIFMVRQSTVPRKVYRIVRLYTSR